MLDPVDGTKPFTTNCYIFGTLIALTREGTPILGAIASPLTRHLLIGLGGTQTQLNGKPVRVRDCRDIKDAVVLTTGHWETASPMDMPFCDCRAERGYTASGVTATAISR